MDAEDLIGEIDRQGTETWEVKVALPDGTMYGIENVVYDTANRRFVIEVDNVPS